ncbi:MAG: KpsF/GutQ family sugar-phosphate isomerase [Alphaproteobacteria bacterium]
MGQPDIILQDNTDSAIEESRRVLTLEAEGILALRESIGQDFHDAIEIFEKCKGRIVVTGMGKSGHIGCKVAATLASTGAPSFFVHPAEASHGDLGMITKDDVVLAMSYSGETAELSNILEFTKRYDIPLVSITGGATSTLAKMSTVCLALPKVGEACPIGLAPTTSTTMTLALGDAIATTLLKRRKFSSEHFGVFHPGGSLGKRLQTVDDIMHSGDELPLADPSLTMQDGLLMMTAKRFGCIGVTGTGGVLTGIVTDGDLRRHMSSDLLSATVGDVMTGSPRTIGSSALVAEALSVMNKNSITSLFVVDGAGKPIGIIHVHDCLRVS